jgi:hypothetical protein
MAQLPKDAMLGSLSKDCGAATPGRGRKHTNGNLTWSAISTQRTQEQKEKEEKDVLLFHNPVAGWAAPGHAGLVAYQPHLSRSRI